MMTLPRLFIHLRSSRTALGAIGLSVVVSLAVWGILPAAAIARSTPTPPTASSSTIQPYVDRVVKNITEFKLENGMKFIVLKRDKAPVVSFVTYADVGGADEPDGQTGVAHFLEHLAFKGTTRIGTIDYAAEKPLLERLDEISAQLKVARANNQTEQVKLLAAEFAKVEAEAAKLVKQNEMGRIVEQAGGVGLNATTSTDATRYFFSFPANKLELWMSLESERFLDPVFREFYREQNVILEERRLRTDNSPIGQMVEAFLDTAFKVHPYRRPVIGYNQDISGLTRDNVQHFFEKYYVPNNLTVAIVGAVDPAEVKRLATIYFGRYKAGPKPPQVTVVEPPQTETREVTLKLKSQPWYLEGYHTPALNNPDALVYEIIGDLLSNGRTSRLYKSLVETKQLALAAQGFTGFPGNKFPNLMLFYALTAPGHTVEEVETALRAEIERLKTELVSTEELERVKTQAKAGLLRSLNSNMGMAQTLLEYEIKTGDWRNLFKQLDRIVAVTPADVQRAAQAAFTPQNRTVGRILPAAS